MKKIILVFFLLTWVFNQVISYNKLEKYEYVYETQVDWKKVGTPVGTKTLREDNYYSKMPVKAAYVVSKTPKKIKDFMKGFIVIIFIIFIIKVSRRKR